MRRFTRLAATVLLAVMAIFVTAPTASAQGGGPLDIVKRLPLPSGVPIGILGGV
ncbi:hypothetical protein [Streptomyces sp. URMC 123]|uniref:hypothetical protein n=1 Tax=Streptomyces sp. URMC 123 TaxID=3423403 RepID=UPI003F1DAF0B